MKRCCKCSEFKSVVEFSKDETKKDGLRSNCKSCVKDYRQSETGKAALKKATRKYRQTEAGKATFKKSNKKASKKYKQINSGKVNANNAKRRALKKNASIGLNPEELSYIASLYEAAAFYSRLHGEPYHVDHIIPLSKGGRHTPSNLRIVTAKDNLSKGSKVPTREEVELIQDSVILPVVMDLVNDSLINYSDIRYLYEK